MRWVFYSLLVLNLVFLGWQLTKQLAPRGPSVTLNDSDSSGGERLILLSEAKQPRKVVAAAASAASGGSLCPVVGPWASRAKAEAGLVQLRASGLNGRVRAVEVQKDRLNWVYLPPYRNREKALSVLRELQNHGVDSFIVKEGENANAISLGYFASAESAVGLRVKMRNAGYPAFVRETARQVTEYWIYLTNRNTADNPDLQAFLEGNQSLEVSQVACH